LGSWLWYLQADFQVTERRLKNSKLIDMTRWSHLVLSEVLLPGDLAVDLTVGNGHDTSFLYKTVGPSGCVVGFDIQTEALEKATARLEAHGASVKFQTENRMPLSREPGVHFFLADHAVWAEYVSGSPKAIIANLGYLPGTDHSLATKAPATISALETSLERLVPGGRVAVVCYVGHPGGREEAESVEELLTGAEGDHFKVLRVENPDARDAPFLLVGEKIV
jgi:SAM-dependent methyltransferase